MLRDMGAADDSDRLPFVRSRALAEAQAHATKPKGETFRFLFPSFRFSIFELLLVSY